MLVINDNFIGTKFGKIKAFGSAIDKGREVSMPEAIYRLLSLPMTKSSVKVKYLSCIHPQFRDGLLKANRENLQSGEPVFHTTPHEYYMNRPFDSYDDDSFLTTDD